MSTMTDTQPETTAFDITTLSDKGFYGESFVSEGYCGRTIAHATQAAAKVWQDVLDTSTVERENRWSSPKYFDITDVADLEVGDLVVEIDTKDGYSYTVRNASVADLVSGWHPERIARVIKKSPKTVTVMYLDNPASWYGYDFDLLGGKEWFTERWGQSANRAIVRLGNAEALQKQIEASEHFPRYQRVQAAAKAAIAEDERRREAKEAAEKVAKDAAEKPFKAPTKALNKALGFKVFTYSTQGVERASGWKKVPTVALTVMLLGRYNMNDVSDQEYTDALDMLTRYAVVEV